MSLGPPDAICSEVRAGQGRKEEPVSRWQQEMDCALICASGKWCHRDQGVRWVIRPDQGRAHKAQRQAREAGGGVALQG